MANLTVDNYNDNEGGSWLSSYYQNVRGLRTKQLEFDIIAFVSLKTWLNDSYYSHNLFPEGHTVYRSDRVSYKTRGGGGALIAFLASLGSCRHRYYLEHCSECV
jgi:hypothetical protein